MYASGLFFWEPGVREIIPRWDYIFQSSKDVELASMSKLLALPLTKFTLKEIHKLVTKKKKLQKNPQKTKNKSHNVLNTCMILVLDHIHRYPWPTTGCTCQEVCAWPDSCFWSLLWDPGFRAGHLQQPGKAGPMSKGPRASLSFRVSCHISLLLTMKD